MISSTVKCLIRLNELEITLNQMRGYGIWAMDINAICNTSHFLFFIYLNTLELKLIYKTVRIYLCLIPRNPMGNHAKCCCVD